MRTELKEGLLRGAATVLLLSAVFWSAGQTAILVNEDQAETEDRFCVVIDAGHGGVDPGKVGMNGELEKELNLQTASGRPNRDKVANITKAQVREIAELKMPDLNAASIEAAMSMVAGTARSMGVVVVD